MNLKQDHSSLLKLVVENYEAKIKHEIIHKLKDLGFQFNTEAELFDFCRHRISRMIRPNESEHYILDNCIELFVIGTEIKTVEQYGKYTVQAFKTFK